MKRPAEEPNESLVYSTHHGRMCPGCRRPLGECACARTPAVHRGDGVVRIRRETSGRRGKEVTVVTGLDLEPDALSQLARELKQRCGSGGTVKAGTIEIQGDHLALLQAELTGRGYTVKRVG